MQEKRLRQQLRTSVFERKGKASVAPKLQVEICVLRVRPSGWRAQHGAQHQPYSTLR